MSAITDAIRLLNGDSSAFALLPAVNYFYIYWRVPNPDDQITNLTLFAFIISSVGFNILNRVNFKSYLEPATNNSDSDEEKILSKWSLLILLGSAALWIIVLGKSVYGLIELFGETTIWPEALVAISGLLVCLIITDLLLTVFLPVYDENES